jgi:hypothetical protein
MHFPLKSVPRWQVFYSLIWDCLLDLRCGFKDKHRNSFDINSEFKLQDHNSPTDTKVNKSDFTVFAVYTSNQTNGLNAGG